MGGYVAAAERGIEDRAESGREDERGRWFVERKAERDFFRVRGIVAKKRDAQSGCDGAKEISGRPGEGIYSGGDRGGAD